MAFWQSSDGPNTYAPETDKTRTIVLLGGDRFRWDALSERWRSQQRWLSIPDRYMTEFLATGEARYWNVSQAIKPKSKRNLRSRVLNGVG